MGTRKQARPCASCSGSVWAKISATSEKLPSEIHIFWPLIDQPRVGLGRAGAQVGGVGAGVGLGQAEAAERLARAEPRQPLLLLLLACPTSRSSRRPARSAPRRRCGRRSRRGRPARRSARSRCSRGRGRRTPRRPARRGSRPRRACSPARGRSGRRGRSPCTRGDDLLVGEFARRLGDQASARRSTGSPSHSASLGLVSSKLAAPGSRRRPPGPRGCGGRGPAGSSAPSIAETAWISRVVEARKASLAARRSATGQAPSSTCSALTRRSRVIDSSTPSSSAGVRSAPSAETQKIGRGRRLEHGAVGRDQHRLVGALRLRRSASPACWRRRRAT